MKNSILFFCLVFATMSIAQVEKANSKRINTSSITKEVADLKTEVFILDRTSNMYLEFAEKIGISNDELLILEELQIFPNPNDGFFTIRFKEQPGATVDVAIYDLTGKAVFSDQIEGDDQVYIQDVDITNREKGIYFLLLKQNDASQTRKIQKL